MENRQSVVECSAFYGIAKRLGLPESLREKLSFHKNEKQKSQKMSELVEGFLEYAQYEISFSPQTIIKYRDSLRCFIRDLVFNGCPIVHVKEILGHERLDTTCKYYLGVDKEQAKKAHRQYLDFVT